MQCCSTNLSKISSRFTDRRLFLEHLSVKPRPKPLKSYGQTAVFAHFVRNRHFSGRPFTDKVSIFIDVSVNGNDFDKCSAVHHLLNRCTWPRLRAKRWFLRFARNLRPHCFGEGNRVEHFSDFWRFCLLLRSRGPILESQVDKNEAFPPVFVYFRDRASRIWRVR